MYNLFMPTLTWIGKEAVVGHHKEVPLHLLVEDPTRGAGDPAADNLLIEGDNLLALKALLPRYAGQVKCIYIDPPSTCSTTESFTTANRRRQCPHPRPAGPAARAAGLRRAARGLRRGLPAQPRASAPGQCHFPADSV